MNDIVVELKPHVGHQSTRIGVLEVDLGQWMIYANKIHVGYVSKEPGNQINLIHMTLPLSAKEEIRRQVDLLLGRVNSPIANAAVILEEDDDYEESEE